MAYDCHIFKNNTRAIEDYDKISNRMKTSCLAKALGKGVTGSHGTSSRYNFFLPDPSLQKSDTSLIRTKS
jgi:hypothetical protein